MEDIRSSRANLAVGHKPEIECRSEGSGGL